jgi:phosphoribosyl 1,2-cyclic phosphodiesterase
MTAPIRVRLWGVRGSLPVAGAGFRRFGGHTICIELRCGPHVLVIDAGTGIAPLGKALLAEGVHDIALFLTHAHYDHVMGLPFFAPFYSRACRVTLACGPLPGGLRAADLPDALMRPPFFPIDSGHFSADLRFLDLTPGGLTEPFPGLAVRTGAMNHPQGGLGYRIEYGGKAVAVVTDTEHCPGAPDDAVHDLIRGADLMLYDATYCDAEMARHTGWGHSTWQEGIRLAQAAGVARLGLIHHAEWRDDRSLAATDRAARRRMPGAFVAREGEVIEP